MKFYIPFLFVFIKNVTTKGHAEFAAGQTESILCAQKKKEREGSEKDGRGDH